MPPHTSLLDELWVLSSICVDRTQYDEVQEGTWRDDDRLSNHVHDYQSPMESSAGNYSIPTPQHPSSSLVCACNTEAVIPLRKPQTDARECRMYWDRRRGYCKGDIIGTSAISISIPSSISLILHGSQSKAINLWQMNLNQICDQSIWFFAATLFYPFTPSLRSLSMQKPGWRYDTGFDMILPWSRHPILGTASATTLYLERKVVRLITQTYILPWSSKCALDFHSSWLVSCHVNSIANGDPKCLTSSTVPCQSL